MFSYGPNQYSYRVHHHYVTMFEIINSSFVYLFLFLFHRTFSSIHHIDGAGLTPIHIATVSGLTSIIEELVSLGAGLNPQSHDGQTPLHVAIRLCHCKKRTG